MDRHQLLTAEQVGHRLKRGHSSPSESKTNKRKPSRMGEQIWAPLWKDKQTPILQAKQNR